MINVEQLRALNAQEWQDFKKHWPMVILKLLIDAGGGFLFGVAFCLAIFIHALEYWL